MKKLLLAFFVFLTIAPSVFAFSAIYDTKGTSSSSSYKSQGTGSSLSNTAYVNARQNTRDTAGMRESTKSASYNRARAYGNFRQRTR